MSPPITESGMQFGPYPAGHCFHIEKSAIYGALESGVKMAEFLWLRPQQNKAPVVWIVEARSSSPRPDTQPNFEKFVREICEKFVNALSLSLALVLRRHGENDTELPGPFRKLNLTIVGFRFVLVISGHEKAWLPPLKDKLSNALRPTMKTWGMGPNAVTVINDSMAQQRDLIANS